MIPPTVEKEVKGDTGCRDDVGIADEELQRSRRRAGTERRERAAAGTESRPGCGRSPIAKMFDNLVGNIDPNLGNWLVDPVWNLILIDHTRAFTNTKDLYHQLVFVDDELWAKMQALDEPSLTTALGRGSTRGRSRPSCNVATRCRKSSTSWPRRRHRDKARRRGSW